LVSGAKKHIYFHQKQVTDPPSFRRGVTKQYENESKRERKSTVEML